jgi:DNA-binding transcriptional MerR regulator
MMAERAHLSIGEVLNLLQSEFPDVTISKIRFLESQGLIDPERTESGYRKFKDVDVKRLRWILHQQRDHFLPLKVIKDRLQSGELDLDEPLSGGDAPVGGDGTDRAESTEPAEATTDPAGDPAVRESGSSGSGQVRKRRPKAAQQSFIDVGAVAELPDEAETGADPPGAGRRSLDLGASGISLDAAELADAAGLSLLELAELQRFGIIESRRYGDDEIFDENALLVARLAVTFRQFGIEPRHLRSYKVAADREAGLYEQVLMPHLRQRDPSERDKGRARLQDLVDHGADLRAAMLRQALKDHLA